MWKLLTIGAVAVLAGCATTAPSSDSIGPKPTNYQDDIRAHIRESFFDPYSLRDTSISEPMVTNTVFDGVTPFPHSGWIVCFRANGKNRFGAYTGMQTTVFVFKEGKLALSIDSAQYAAQVENHCAPAQYQSFKTEIS